MAGIAKRDRRKLALTFIILLLFGGSVFSGLMPYDTSVSWETHLTGALAGILCAIIFRNAGFTEEDISSKKEELIAQSNVSVTSNSQVEWVITYKKAENNEGKVIKSG